MDGLIIPSAFKDPVIIALIFGVFACGVIAWVLRTATLRARAAGRRRWSIATNAATWIFVTLCGFHIGAVLSGVGEVDGARYSHIVASLQSRPQMIGPFVEAMSDGRMTLVEYWSVRRHGGLVDRADMRTVSTDLAKALRAAK